MSESLCHLSLIPPEIFERILSFLDLESLKSVRLTSKGVSARCLQPTFSSYFHNRETDMTPKRLRRLLDLCSHPRLGQCVKRITIVAVYYDTSIATERLRLRHARKAQDREREFLEAAAEQQWLLARRQELLDRFTEMATVVVPAILKLVAHLEALALTARVVRARDQASISRLSPVPDFDWRYLWVEAQRLFVLTMQAMANSGLAVDRLSLFDQVEQCSLQSGLLDDFIQTIPTGSDFHKVGEHVKNLSLSFSTPVLTDIAEPIVQSNGLILPNLEPRHLLASAPSVQSPKNFASLSNFLKYMPFLEELDLHFYNTVRGFPLAYEQLLPHLASEVRLSRLKRLTLRGFRTTTEAPLLDFLSHHPTISELELRYFQLAGSTWEPVLQYLSTMPNLKTLHLSNLWCRHKRWLNLAPKNKQFDDGKTGDGYTCPTKRGAVFRHTRDIGAEELKKGLDFVQLDGKNRVKGSKAMMKWISRQGRECGPP